MSSRTDRFNELERLFDRLTRQVEAASTWWGEDPERYWVGSEGFAVDLLEEPDGFIVTVDVPGYERDEIDVRAADRTLHIEANRQEETEASADDYLRRERRRRTHSRSIKLPDDVDHEGITASLKNGVLKVSVPKIEPDEEARQIEVELG